MFSQRSCFAVSLLMVLCLLLAACSNSDNNSTNSTQTTSKVSGRVTNDAGFGNSLSKTNGSVEGATITLVRVESNGSLQIVSNASVKTDINGEFVIETDAEGESGLIVVAEKDNTTWKAVISGEIRNGETTKCQPHNDESTSEAETYEDIKESKDRRPKRTVFFDNQSENAYYADVAAFITAEVAASVGTEGSQIAALAAAIDAEITALEQALLHAEIGATRAEIESVNEAKLEAQVELEVALCVAAGSETHANAAFESYSQGLIDAYIQANIELQSYAKAKEISCAALIKNSSGLNANASLNLKKSSALIRERTRTTACETQFSGIGASNAQIAAVVNAGIGLRTALQNADSETKIESAFEVYHDAVVNELKLILGTQVLAISSIDAAINALGGAKTVLSVSLSAAVTTEAVVEAYTDFYAAVGALVEASLVSATANEISAVAEIMILINM